MAAWQYKVQLIPKSSISDFSITVINEDILDSAEGWKMYDMGDVYITLDKVLKRGNSWSPDIDIWGNESETCVEFIRNNDVISEISIRIDLRQQHPKKLLTTILDITKKLKAVFINAKFELIKEDEKSIINDIKNSDAFCFVSDPKSFLDDL